METALAERMRSPGQSLKETVSSVDHSGGTAMVSILVLFR